MALDGGMGKRKPPWKSRHVFGNVTVVELPDVAAAQLRYILRNEVTPTEPHTQMFTAAHSGKSPSMHQR